jgi:DNA repair protein RadC
MGKILEQEDALLALFYQKILCSRFQSEGIDSLRSHEILDYVLLLIEQKTHIKNLSKRLINRFGTFGNVLRASKSELAEIEGVNDLVTNHLHFLYSVFQIVIKEEFADKPLLSCPDALYEYLIMKYGHSTVEQFVILYLNTAGMLIHEELNSKGTLDKTGMYPREVLKTCLNTGANSIVVVHNHPSGNCNPSKDDISGTFSLITACHPLNISVLDHIIVSPTNYFSFKKNGII